MCQFLKYAEDHDLQLAAALDIGLLLTSVTQKVTALLAGHVLECVRYQRRIGVVN